MYMRRARIVVLLALCAIGIPALFLVFFPAEADDARAIVDRCASQEKRDVCYERELPKLVDEGVSMEDAFDVVREVQELDPSYMYCHVAAHYIAQRETAKDLSKWKDVIARAPSGICGNGALHGAFQERFRAEAWPDATLETLSHEFAGVCDPRDGWNPTHLERASCLHGIGHLSMYVTEANIQKSISLCEKLGRVSDTEDFRMTCMDGAFMQIYQPLDLDDEYLVEELVPQAARRLAFCERFKGDAYTSCIKESWPLFRDKLEAADPETVAAVCAPLSGTSRTYCASGLFYVVMGMISYDPVRMATLCDALPDDIRGLCVASAAARFVETDWKNIPHALAMCADAPDDSRGKCYDGLVIFADQGLPRGSSEARTLCGGMPDGWRQRCAAIARIDV